MCISHYHILLTGSLCSVLHGDLPTIGFSLAATVVFGLTILTCRFLKNHCIFESCKSLNVDLCMRTLQLF